MKCQSLFSRENKKNITNLSAAEIAQKVVKVKLEIMWLSQEPTGSGREKLKK